MQVKRTSHGPQSITHIRISRNEGNSATMAVFFISQGLVLLTVIMPQTPLDVLPLHNIVTPTPQHTLPPSRHFFSQAQPWKALWSVPFVSDRTHIVRGHLWAPMSLTEYVHLTTLDKLRLADTPYIPPHCQRPHHSSLIVSPSQPPLTNQAQSWT